MPISAMSAGSECRATDAMNGTKLTATTQPISPPMVDDITEKPIASPARPFSAIGNPSSAVQAAAGVPGVRSRIEA